MKINTNQTDESSRQILFFMMIFKQMKINTNHTAGSNEWPFTPLAWIPFCAKRSSETIVINFNLVTIIIMIKIKIIEVVCRLWQWKLPILTMNMMKMIMMIFAAKYDKQGSPLKCAALKRVIWGYPALRLLTLERAKMMMMMLMMTMVMMIKMIMTIIWRSLPLLMLPLHPQADQGVKSLCNFPENNFQKKISKIWYIFLCWKTSSRNARNFW